MSTMGSKTDDHVESMGSIKFYEGRVSKSYSLKSYNLSYRSVQLQQFLFIYSNYSPIYM